jgi:hypothetical protein
MQRGIVLPSSRLQGAGYREDAMKTHFTVALAMLTGMATD